MLKTLFSTDKPLIGVIHLLPLPGSARWDTQLTPIYERAEQEAVALTSGGADGIIVENFFDSPFTNGRLDTATISTFTNVISRIKSLTNLPIGINCLRNDGMSALAIACATQAQFIRVNVLAGAMVTDQGIIEGIAHKLLLYRRHLGVDKTIKIFADILVKHAYPINPKADIEQIAIDTRNRALADALIISGNSTGKAPNIDDLQNVRRVLPDCPLLAGSGVDKNNAGDILNTANGAIIGTSLKRQGIIDNCIDVERVRELKSLFADKTNLAKKVD